MFWVGEVLLTATVFVLLCFRLFPFYTAISCIFAAILAVLWKINRYHTHWQRLGISGPEPHFLFGNLGQFRLGIDKAQQKWYEEHGDIVGTYVFGRSELQVSDPAILREVMLQKFSTFTDRVNFIPVNSEDRSNLFSNTLLFLEGEKWKNVRSQVTPAFTSGKIKMMIPMFTKCAQICADLILEKQSQDGQVDLKEICGPLTLEMIAKSGFGAELDIQTHKDDHFLDNAKAYFTPSMKDVRGAILFLFPKLGPLFQRYTGVVLLRPKENLYFTQMLTSILEQKKIEKSSGLVDRKNDFFDILLDSLIEEEKVDDAEFYHEEYSRSKKAVLTQLDIISQGFVFLLAGYDTSSTTMSLLLYHLACYPEVQARLRAEINEHVPDENEITFDQIMACTYLDQVLKEVLRLYPMFVRVNRVCTADTVIGKNIPMRKGDVVAIPIRMMHFKEDVFPDPHTFDPERFSPENKTKIDPLSYIPFGFGPRNCVGMRIAQFLVKSAVVHLVKRMEFSLTEKSATLPLDFQSFGPIKLKDTLLVTAKEITV